MKSGEVNAEKHLCTFTALTSFSERERRVRVPELLDELDVAVVDDVAVLGLDVLQVLADLLLRYKEQDSTWSPRSKDNTKLSALSRKKTLHYAITS